MPRRKKLLTVRTSVALSESQHEQLSRLADRYGVSSGWIIRRAVDDFLESNDQETSRSLPTRERKEASDG